jgi:nucleolar pre-ribosomal-associated protein 1
MVRFLADGMKSSQDWKILTRRHTWELLATLFQASDSDSTLRTGILDVGIVSSFIPPGRLLSFF